jgi:hypothetical protein
MGRTIVSATRMVSFNLRVHEFPRRRAGFVERDEDYPTLSKTQHEYAPIV